VFTQLGLHESLERGIAQLGFTSPTPIQSASIPPARAGRDLIACAMTGTGKTAAFGLPLLDRLIDGPRGSIRALVLTPTRELAAQVERELRCLGAHTRLRTAAIFGGVPMGPQRRAFESGVEVLVATPGRLIDHLERPYARLDRVEMLVLDEADRMLDLGFLPAIRRILARIPAKRQTLLFSATIPRDDALVLRSMVADPVLIDLPRRSSAATGISHGAYAVARQHKTSLLIELLRGPTIDRALVFTRTKHRADRLARALARHAIPSAVIHGDRTQGQRTQALTRFKDGQTRVLVATDVAARGIDVANLSHVINFDVPPDPESYVHRAGRTARARSTGDALTFVAPEEESEMRRIEKTIGQRVARLQLPCFGSQVADSGPCGTHGTPSRRSRFSHRDRPQRPVLPAASRVTAARRGRRREEVKHEGSAVRSFEPVRQPQS